MEAIIRCDYKYLIYVYDYEQIFRASTLNPYKARDIEITQENIDGAISNALETGLPLYGYDIEDKPRYIDFVNDEKNLERKLSELVVKHEKEKKVIYVVQIPCEYLTGEVIEYLPGRENEEIEGDSIPTNIRGRRVGCTPILKAYASIDAGYMEYITPYLIRGYINCLGTDLGFNENKGYNPAFDCRGLRFTKNQEKIMRTRSAFWTQWIETGKGMIGYLAEMHAANIFDESLPRRLVYKEDHERRRASKKPVTLKLEKHS